MIPEIVVEGTVEGHEADGDRISIRIRIPSGECGFSRFGVLVPSGANANWPIGCPVSVTVKRKGVKS